jgi:hypothetical protein
MNISQIRPDCFALIKGTNQLVQVLERTLPTLNLWKTTGGEFHATELQPIVREMAVPILQVLLTNGVKIVYKPDSTWSVQ